MNTVAHSITVTALAALIVPFAQRRLGVRLDNDDVVTLVTIALGLWHGAVAAFNRWGAPYLDKLVAAHAAVPTLPPAT